MRRHKALYSAGWVVALFSFNLALHAQEAGGGVKEDKPIVTIAVVPPCDPGGPEILARIAGSVKGAQKGCRIVIFVHGDVWYVQPYTAAPYTEIDSAGKWSTVTHLGTEYAALLVCGDSRPLDKTVDLPRKSGAVFAIARVAGK